MSSDQFIVALIAATLAFAFFLAGELLTHAYDRYRRHHNALCALEKLMNSHVDTIDFYRKLIVGMREDVEAGRLIKSVPGRLRIDDQVFSDLYDETLMNDYFVLRQTVGKINHWVETLNSSYELFAGRLLDGTFESEKYTKNVLTIVGGYENLTEELKDYCNDTKEFMAKVRLHLGEEKSLAWRVVQWTVRKIMMSPNPAQITAENIKSERDKMECELTRQQSVEKKPSSS